MSTIVVGAGPAGAVLAARLVEAGEDVLLIEAGPDYGPFGSPHWPETLLDPTRMPVDEVSWNYLSAAQHGLPDHHLQRSSCALFHHDIPCLAATDIIGGPHRLIVILSPQAKNLVHPWITSRPFNQGAEGDWLYPASMDRCLHSSLAPPPGSRGRHLHHDDQGQGPTERTPAGGIQHQAHRDGPGPHGAVPGHRASRDAVSPGCRIAPHQ